MVVESKHNQPKARPKGKTKKQLEGTKYLNVKEKNKQKNLVLQITTRHQYTINIPPLPNYRKKTLLVLF